MESTSSTEYGDTVVVRRHVEEPVRHEPGWAESRPVEARREVLTADGWQVRWTAVWLGALVTLLVMAILGLAASAIGNADAAAHLTTWSAYSRSALIYSIFTALIAGFLGGFLAVKVTHARHFEPGLLHGALVWLVVFPALLVLGAIGAGHFFGNFAMGIVGAPAWMPADVNSAAVNPVTASAVRDVDISAMFAILMGLAGAMLGGWLASTSDRPYWRQSPFRATPRQA